MTPRLMGDRVDFNDPAVLGSVLRAAMVQLKAPDNWHSLEIHLGSYFRTKNSEPPSVPGWYVVVDLTGRPLYVGESENLNSRLNSSNGSLDGFHDSTRKAEPARNFLKAFVVGGHIEGLRVGVVEKIAVLHELGLEGSLSKVDRCNVEKVMTSSGLASFPETAVPCETDAD